MSSRQLLKNIFLFEVSWEVCNKVGGIYTVLRSKLKEVSKNLGNNYIMVGPLLDQNRHFLEEGGPFCDVIKSQLANKNFDCRVGRWDTEGQPLVVLVDFKNRYNIDVLLYNLWTDFGIDSLASNYEYYEPILFATAAAEVIEILSDNILPREMQVVAHFHEWLCGAGILYLKKHRDNISTVFTTHATVLGRALSGDNKLVYNLPQTFDPSAEAKKYGVSVAAKHWLETASAKNAICFTTVSEITGIESLMILGRYPDKIVMNGLDIERKQHLVIEDAREKCRAILRITASKVVGKILAENSLLWVTSGRSEFHNKGFDVLLKSLSQLEKRLPKESPPIIVFFLIASNWRSKQDSLLEPNITLTPNERNALGISTHKLNNPSADGIIRACNELNLRQPENKIHVIYSDAYLNGSDGVFDILYEEALAACDLSIFPSFYEPWGYTPLESIAYAVPTITTDLSGFGNWVSGLSEDYKDAVLVLPRANKSEADFTTSLTDALENVVKQHSGSDFKRQVRKKALAIAELADWEHFYIEYLKAYEQAVNFNEIYHAKFDLAGEEESITAIHDAEVVLPRFRQIQYESLLPEKLSALRDIAYNFWWVWNYDAKTLFQRIDSELWESVNHNPVHFLNLVSSSSLQKASHNDDFMHLYLEILDRFQNYEKERAEVIRFCSTPAVGSEHPIAYFCLEYGIDECLPIYSGGLGILAGDYIKAMSDLKAPMIAIGLFYKQGYFFQSIDSHGDQVALYKDWDVSQIPMKQVLNEFGKPTLVGVEMLGKTVHAQTWEVKVGHINLYLLDTDVPENSIEDRSITNSLYGGSRENRLKQEMLLGIGGVRFILEKLKLKPAIYHLNEGHSAFLLLERIKNYHLQGMSFNEALELVRASSIFTTHTPVPAGNEVFPEDLIKKYFISYVESLGISMDKLLSLAKDVDPSTKVFSMTALSLRLTLQANAVSTLHGKVARSMWKAVWPTLLEGEVPLGHVTNGVHLQTWLGRSMKLLYDDSLKSEWERDQDDPQTWKKLLLVPDNELWKAHQTQKAKLIEIIKNQIIQQYSYRNESKQLISSSIENLDVNTLIIGLARRFTGYKRNDLILKDRERLASILTDEKRPVVMVIAGKAHPADSGGSNLIRDFIEVSRDKNFKGHVIFLEEYNIALAKALVQGVDVWVNTPILGREACGTSGMKVGVNGGLNFSTKDGWWEEAYDYRLGWEITSMVSIENLDRRNDLENMFLLNTLESDIVTLYYQKNRYGFNPDWVAKMKASIALTACRYNAYRMARDYIEHYYCSSALQTDQLVQNNYAVLKKIIVWKQDVAERFKTVKIKAILINGIKDGKIIGDGLIKLKVLIFSGKLNAKELKVEFVLTKNPTSNTSENVSVITLKSIDAKDSGILTFIGEYKIEDTGFYSYGIRVFPYNEMLLTRYDSGLVYWG